MFSRRLFHTTVIRQSPKDYYGILQINPQADKKTIKAHYYRLSKKYHPDLNPNNQDARQKFLEINEAYAILGNEANRRQYDQAGSSSPMAERSQSHYAHAWQFKRRNTRSTGSASARAQAEQRAQESSPFNPREHFTRHYEAEEQRRRHRMAQAAERLGHTPFVFRHRKENNAWARFWKLGLVLAGISYTADYVLLST